LQLVPSSKNISFCGRHIYESIAEVADSIALNLQFIYLDSDICVSMTGGDKDNLQVYTKNEDWIESRKQRVSVHSWVFEGWLIRTFDVFCLQIAICHVLCILFNISHTFPDDEK
jgi:hypothetical protein